MSVTSGVKCHNCGGIIMTMECVECGKISSYSVDELVGFAIDGPEEDSIDQVMITCPVSELVH
ncbi:MAG: hypothetical protein ABL899_01145 [Nitrospira sp.]